MTGYQKHRHGPWIYAKHTCTSNVHGGPCCNNVCHGMFEQNTQCLVTCEQEGFFLEHAILLHSLCCHYDYAQRKSILSWCQPPILRTEDIKWRHT